MSYGQIVEVPPVNQAEVDYRAAVSQANADYATNVLGMILTRSGFEKIDIVAVSQTGLGLIELTFRNGANIRFVPKVSYR
jgi:hypothetical protein